MDGGTADSACHYHGAQQRLAAVSRRAGTLFPAFFVSGTGCSSGTAVGAHEGVNVSDVDLEQARANPNGLELAGSDVAANCLVAEAATVGGFLKSDQFRVPTITAITKCRFLHGERSKGVTNSPSERGSWPSATSAVDNAWRPTLSLVR